MFYVPSPASIDNDGIMETGSEPKTVSSNNNYETELQILCGQNENVMRQYVLSGNLRSSKTRSIFWRVLLGIFPTSSTIKWLSVIRESREYYNGIKNTFTLDPHRTSSLPDDNPLSQDKNSIWYRYFCDKELKRIIRQDVIRTSPEKQFFQSPSMHETMINILFLYARENPEICYRQGMHEILAPILYIFHEDYYYFSTEKASVMHSTLSEIMDPEFLEHDVFHFFSLVMARIGQYYRINCVPNASGHFPIQENSNQIVDTRDSMAESAISLYLNELRDKIQKYDRQLHDHLRLLNIPFTAFGIRWLRLLFGREFSFSDLLVLWDAVFVVDSDFVLVSYILIAMLIVIREKLLNSDYMQCLNYLMKYPNTVDVMYVIKYAIYLKEPTIYKKPLLPVNKNTNSRSTQLPADNVHSKSNIHKNSVSKQTTSITKRLKNIKINSTKKLSKENDFNLIDDYSTKTFEMVVSELKHMQVVMSLCKLKLYQYHEILTASVSEDDIKAQHALTGIQELCTLLDIDHFSLKSSPNGPPNIETGREAGELSIGYDEETAPHSLHPTVDAIAMYLPPPNTDIDMTIFKRSECGSTDGKGFPLENPLGFDKYD